MAIATYWDRVYDFSASEAAYLILGMEPEEKSRESLKSVKHLVRRMNVAFIDIPLFGLSGAIRYCPVR